MKSVKIENAQQRTALAYGGTADDKTKPTHAVIHKPRKGEALYVVALSARRTSIELPAGTRIRVGSLDEASDARYCTKTGEAHDEPQPMYVSTYGRETYCRACDHHSRKQYRAMKKAGVDVRQAAADRRVARRQERIERVVRHTQEQRERTEREHFAVTARNILYGVASGVEVQPGGQLVAPNGYPEVGANLPMRGPKAQRRMFALAQFTALCSDRGYTVHEAADLLGVEAEPVSWADYRKTYPLRREYDETEEAAA